MLVKMRGLMARRGVRGAAMILAGQGVNFFVQAGYFFLLARLLGATEYGVFAGAFAVVNIITPYSSLGAGVLFMRYVTEKGQLAATYWGNSLLLTTVMTGIIGGLACFVGPWITHNKSLWLVLALVLANCLFSQVVTTASRIFQTYDRLNYSSFLLLLSNVTRFAVLLAIYLTLHRATATEWAFGVVFASGIAFLISFVMVQRTVGAMNFDPRLMVRRLWEGLTFSLSATSSSVYNDFDKTILSSHGMNFENGIYTLGYRVIDFATTPVMAMDTALLPRYFQMKKYGMSHLVRKSLQYLAIIGMIGIGVSIFLWLVSPVVPKLVGPDFALVVTAVRWLCLIPFLRGLHTISGGALTGAGHQPLRMLSQVIVAVANIGLNLWLIPKYGWIAACWTSLASDGLLAVLNVSVLGWFWLRYPQAGAASTEQAAS